MQNFRPGVVERLGIGPDDLLAVNDRLIYVSLSGFGPVGPYAHKGAYDTVIQAYGGFAANQTDPESGQPRFLNQTAADKVTALYAAQAITAALFARERGAGGCHVQLAMLDAVVSFLWADAAGNEVLQDADRSQPSSFVQNFKPFRFLDGWGICTPTSDANFAGMCRAFRCRRLRRPARRDDRRSACRTASSPVSSCSGCYASAAQMTTADAIGRLEAEQVPCGVVIAPDELAADPHALVDRAPRRLRVAGGRAAAPAAAPDAVRSRAARARWTAPRRSVRTPSRCCRSSATASASTSCAWPASSADGGRATYVTVSVLFIVL